MEETNTALMKEAHDVIFAAEASKLSAPAGTTAASELSSVQEKISKLKDLILKPAWPKTELTNSLAELRSAHSLLTAKLKEEHANKVTAEAQLRQDEIEKGASRTEEGGD